MNVFKRNRSRVEARSYLREASHSLCIPTLLGTFKGLKAVACMDSDMVFQTRSGHDHGVFVTGNCGQR
ncbi:hypothetical protein RSAG8_04590, partial [Rhizoctonia solani AG-8 WAC10335]